MMFCVPPAEWTQILDGSRRKPPPIHPAGQTRQIRGIEQGIGCWVKELTLTVRGRSIPEEFRWRRRDHLDPRVANMRAMG